MIGAQYWLSPTQIFPERVIKLAELKEEFRLQTSLSVIARTINLKVYEQISSEMLVDDAVFWKFVDDQLHAIKNAENALGGSLEIERLDYPSRFSALPFLFFVPEHSEFDSRVYDSSGAELKSEIQLSGIASESKLGINFTRPLSANEGYWEKGCGETSRITDSFITEMALPNERILGWIKYGNKLEFEIFQITYDEVGIKKDDFQLKNVKDNVKTTKPNGGILQIQRKDIAMDGLVAFTCKYSMIPDFEKVTNFELDFMKSESVVQTINLKTGIVRPILRMPQEGGNFELVQPPESVSKLLVAHYPQKYAWTGEEKPEKVFISNVGSAEAKNVKLLAESSNPDIKVNLKISKTIDFFKGLSKRIGATLRDSWDQLKYASGQGLEKIWLPIISLDI